MINCGLEVNLHALRVGIILDSDFRERYYMEQLRMIYGIDGTKDDLKRFMKEDLKRNMGQKVNPHGLRVGVIKDWDSKWYPENTEDNFYISEDLIHHSLENRKIHLVKLLGKKKYRETVKKVKTLSR